MVASGRQLAAGPITDSPAEETEICGFGLFQRGSLDEVRRLMDADPGVRQGLYCFDVMTWRTPAGYLAFPSAARAPERRPQGIGRSWRGGCRVRTPQPRKTGARLSRERPEMRSWVIGMTLEADLGRCKEPARLVSGEFADLD